MNKQKEHEKFSKKYQRLEAKSAKLQAEYKALEEACTHPLLRYRNCGSDGGWDYESSYWTDWYCPTCSKRWTTDQKYDTTKIILKLYPQAQVISPYGKTSEIYQKFYERDLGV